MQRNERSSRIFRKTARYQREAKALGHRLRKIRLAQNLTLEDVYERSDVDAKALQKIEVGKGNVSLVTLLRLAIGLRQPIAVFFGGHLLDPPIAVDDADAVAGDERGDRAQLPAKLHGRTQYRPPKPGG
jgi:transcriptional regulator with XRE-family HTH domain